MKKYPQYKWNKIKTVKQKSRKKLAQITKKMKMMMNMNNMDFKGKCVLSDLIDFTDSD